MDCPTNVLSRKFMHPFKGPKFWMVQIEMHEENLSWMSVVMKWWEFEDNIGLWKESISLLWKWPTFLTDKIVVNWRREGKMKQNLKIKERKWLKSKQWERGMFSVKRRRHLWSLWKWRECFFWNNKLSWSPTIVQTTEGYVSTPYAFDSFAFLEVTMVLIYFFSNFLVIWETLAFFYQCFLILWVSNSRTKI